MLLERISMWNKYNTKCVSNKDSWFVYKLKNCIIHIYYLFVCGRCTQEQWDNSIQYDKSSK